jgi:hypothetical protein
LIPTCDLVLFIIFILVPLNYILGCYYDLIKMINLCLWIGLSFIPDLVNSLMLIKIYIVFL